MIDTEALIPKLRRLWDIAQHGARSTLHGQPPAVAAESELDSVLYKNLDALLDVVEAAIAWHKGGPDFTGDLAVRFNLLHAVDRLMEGRQ